MILDILIVLLLISAVFRGKEIGFVQQLFSTVGFFGGLFLGAKLQPHTVNLVQGETNRTLVTLVTTLGLAVVFLLVGELLGILAKRKLTMGKGKFNRVDNYFGSVLSVISIMIAVWLSAAIVRSMPYQGLQQAFRDSAIASSVSKQLPYAPNIIAGLGNLINPNGFPQVFAGVTDRDLPAKINLPKLSCEVERAKIMPITSPSAVTSGPPELPGSTLAAIS